MFSPSLLHLSAVLLYCECDKPPDWRASLCVPLRCGPVLAVPVRSYPVCTEGWGEVGRGWGGVGRG